MPQTLFFNSVVVIPIVCYRQRLFALHIGTQQTWWYYRHRMQEFFCSIPQVVLTKQSRARFEVPTMWQSSSIPQEMHFGRWRASSEIVPAPPWVQNFVTVVDGVRAGSSCVVLQPDS